jgi:CrcB protein
MARAPSHKGPMWNLLYVGLGGAVGSVARYLLSVQATRVLGPGFPFGTFIANLVGGLLMGVLVGLLAHKGGADQERWRLLLAVGVLGGFTTFSSYSLEVVRMIETRSYGQAAGYSLGSVVLAVAAVFLGLMLARRLFA